MTAFIAEVKIDLPDIEGFADQAWSQMGRHITLASLAVKARISENARRRLNKRSRSALRASWLQSEIEIREGRAEISGKFGSRLPYAAIHDEGGTIHAKKRLLAIPAGSDKGYRHEELSRKGPRSFKGKGGWVQHKKTGTMLFVEWATGNVLFIGKPSVKIPASWYIRDGIATGMPKAEQIIVDGYTAEIQRLIDAGGE